MSLWDALRHRARVLLRPGDFERELEEEIRFHLSLESMQQAHAGGGGVSGAEAARAARRRFGNEVYLKEETRLMAGLGFFDAVRQDVRFAVRTFRRMPGFTAVAVLTLAIGIGANTAIFSAVNALLLRPLPFPEPERLMSVSIVSPGRGELRERDDFPWSYPKFVVVRDAQTVFRDIALYTSQEFTLSGEGEAERDYAEVVGARYLPVLGVQPVLGRGFLAEEDRHPDSRRVVLLGEALWKRRFNADPAVLGRAVDVDGKPYTIVGVLPAGFRGLSGRAEFWLPVMSQSADMVGEAWSHEYSAVARLKPGVTPERATEQVKLLGRRMAEAYPDPVSPGGVWGATARELDARRVDPLVRRSLLVLLGAVGLVLLIACANVANLFLVRAAGRRREVAVRLAVGAARRRLVRQLVTESLLLALLGGAASLAVAWWGVKLLSALNPLDALRVEHAGGLGAVAFSSIRLDPTAFAFTAGLALATGVLFGLVPALQATHPSLVPALKGGEWTRRERAPRGLTGRNALAVAEIALAVVLLAGSGVTLRSLARLVAVDPGFDPAHVLTMRLNLPAEGFSRDSMPGFYEQVVERLEAIPGAAGVALQDCPPLNGGCNGTMIDLRDRPPVPRGSGPVVGVHWVTPNWAPVMRVRLERGRTFEAGDRLGGRKVVLVSETAARRFWPGRDPIGRPVGVGQGGFWEDTAYVVGVVGDVRYNTLDSIPQADVYLPYAQSPRGRMMVLVRTAGDPLAVVGAARQALRELAPDVPVYDVRTMEGRVADAAARARFSAVLLAIFAALALALATLGIYGVISYGVAQRTREIGIRVALGARRRDVVAAVVRGAFGLAAAGAALGVLGALAATRVLRSLLYGVAPSDPVAFVAAVALLAATGVLASWVPARRAASVQPVEALREG
ncbi:MAG TPA: ABC transporter permease [Longimicrobiales bacterium]|nr:ABC transporter permease [Longimicrobiales bacterium]